MINETEKRVLQSLHLRGCTGSMGSMNHKQRRELLQGLITKGYLNNKAEVTPAGIEISAPKYN